MAAERKTGRYPVGKGTTEMTTSTEFLPFADGLIVGDKEWSERWSDVLSRAWVSEQTALGKAIRAVIADGQPQVVVAPELGTFRLTRRKVPGPFGSSIHYEFTPIDTEHPPTPSNARL